MFDRFVRLAQVRRALQGGRPEEALRLLGDPLIAGQRRAEELRREAVRVLCRRGAERAAAGDHAGAESDYQAACRALPDDEDAAAGLAAVRSDAAAARAARDEGAACLAAARQSLEAGDLAAAEQRLADLDPRDPQVLTLVERIRRRRAAAAEVLREAESALAAGHHERARDLLARARATDAQASGGGVAGVRLATAMGTRIGNELAAATDGSDPCSLASRYAAEIASLPELGSHPAMARARRRIAAAVAVHLQGLIDALRLEELVVAARRLPEVFHGVAALADIVGLARHVEAALAHQGRGEWELAAEALRAAADAPCGKALGSLARTAEAEAAALESERRQIRAAVAAGDVDAATQCLGRALVRWPTSRSLSEERRVLDDTSAERARQLGQIQDDLRDGRLRRAFAQALALGVSGPSGEEARRLQQEIQARLDQVAAGLDAVRRAVHGRTSASEDGLACCLSQLDDLARIQCDHDELPRLRSALEAELRGLRLLAAATASCEDAPASLVDSVREVVGLRNTLLTPERLDARLCALADTIAARADRALDAGAVRVAEQGLAALALLTGLFPVLARRVADLEVRRVDAGRLAAAAAARGRAALAERDLSAAESSLDVAQRLAGDDEEVRSLARDVGEMRGRLRDLDEIGSLAERRDFARAQERLASMPPTPGMLRTRIFDMKRDLARAQGLDGGFLLRVDEGGEFLVLRSESVTIGNLRDGGSDLCVLANIAGQHARIERRMSFHGGMEDRIRSDRGAVLVGSRAVSEHRLRDGDEVGLGKHLQFVYRLPSNRSLTALLRLRGGFQACGTDKVLLLKDRGRDGRILIGNAKDAHVPLGVDGPEVELFASKDGQIRVRWPGEGGTIDGRPFQGEHPVIPGAVVVCGGISFVLLPRP